MGRHRKPIEVKEREGTRIQPCRVMPNIPRPTHSWPTPIEKLSAAEKKLWNFFCQSLDDLGVIAVTDIWLIHELTTTKQELDALRKALKQRGRTTFVSETGVVKPYPEVSQIDKTKKHYVSLLSRAGLTPVDRMRVSATEKAPETSQDFSFLDD